MNLHFFIDEKVVPRIIDIYNKVCGENNKYVIVTPSKDYKPKYVKGRVENMSVATYKSKEFYEYIGDISQYKFIVLHGLTSNMIDFINHHPHSGYWWRAWGGDLYESYLDYKGYNSCYDKDEIQKFMGYNSLMHQIVKPLNYIKKYFYLQKKEKAIKRITYIGAVEGDVKILKEYNPSFRHLIYRSGGFYYPINTIVNSEICDRPLGSNIIVGNSANATGNHVEIFKCLSNLDIGNRKVIVPLSYGDVAPYIIAKGQEYINENFEPITQFMPLNEYNELLLSAHTFIYNSYRQMAFGNILVALFIGGTVFLNERNPLSDLFRKKGCHFYLLSDLPNKINYRLTEKERLENKKILLESYSEKKLMEIVKETLS